MKRETGVFEQTWLNYSSGTITLVWHSLSWRLTCDSISALDVKRGWELDKSHDVNTLKTQPTHAPTCLDFRQNWKNRRFLLLLNNDMSHDRAATRLLRCHVIVGWKMSCLRFARQPIRSFPSLWCMHFTFIHYHTDWSLLCLSSGITYLIANLKSTCLKFEPHFFIIIS